MRHRLASIALCCLLVCCLSVLAAWMPTASAMAQTASPSAAPTQNIQPYLDRVASRITEFKLESGIKFIVMERHQVPIVSFMTYVNIGSAYEQPGKTGAAHFLEHLAFKGTTQIGTTDYSKEKPLLDELDALTKEIQTANTLTTSSLETSRLQQEFDQTKAKASSYVKQNEFGRIVEQAGGVGLNATTSADATRYFYSFPSNKLELWMSLESERFLDPVFREFYEEKDVILEERRMRTDNSPIGKMTEAFLDVALPNHPYGRPVIGSEQDLRGLTRADIQQFYQTHYTPDQIVIAIVGDVDPAQVKTLAQAYFGRYQARQSAPSAPTLNPAKPNQTEPHQITLSLPSQPWYLEGYQRPDINDPDNATYAVLSGILSSGRTARLYKSLVEQKQLALNVNVVDSFPGDRYSNLLLLYALTAPGHTLDEVAIALDAELTRLKTEPVSAEELDRIKTQAKASLLGTLASNQGMASLLPEYEAKTGSWRNLFAQVKAIDAVTAADIQRVAQTLFQPKNLTIGKIVSAE